MTISCWTTLADNIQLDRLQKGLLAFWGVLLLSGCWQGQSNEIVEFRGSTMGTTYSVKLSSLPPALAYSDLQRDIRKVLDEIDHLMSTHLPSSEISSFNSYQKTDWFAFSPLTMQVIRRALLVSHLSNGAFDPTVGNLVSEWGFSKTSRKNKIPEAAVIKSILQKTGYQQIIVDENKQSLKKSNSTVTIDLSAIAKGFAVDKVAHLLERHKIDGYLVEVGGEIRAKGTKRIGRPWIIAIEKPVVSARTIYKTLSIGQNGMATSGDYRNFFIRNDRRYSHVIDPKTGYPISHDTGSVTVIHPSCAMADAWATALLVLGREKGYEMAIRNNLSALFVYRTGSGFEDKGTPGFFQYVKK